MTISPIPTIYKGINFRSRLEARWAMFFDSLKLKWYYEYQGFQIKDVWYVPDFLVVTPSGYEYWIEIKPVTIKNNYKFDIFKKSLETESEKSEFAYNPRCFLASGDPSDVMENNVLCPRCGLFIENDECTSLSFFNEASGLVSIYCESCDFETPGGRGDTHNDGILSFKYQPWKGYLRFHYLDWMDFLNSIKKKADRVSKHRF